MQWTIERLPRKPTAIALVTDNFEKQTLKYLYEQSKPMRIAGVEMMMARGRVKGDYTHVSINEALQYGKRMRGDHYIQRV
ncbi:hypothetical protein ABTB42_20515, partial [Acinetobacter baumannii]